MIGQNKIATFAVACLAVLANANMRRLPSFRTWMQEPANSHLDMSIKEFFTKAQDDQDEEDPYGIIKPIGNNRVKINDDILVSDYISVQNWYWDDVVVPEPEEDSERRVRDGDEDDENKDEE